MYCCIVCLYCTYSEYNVTDTWNGWLTEYNAGLVLSQQFAAVQLVLYFSTFSLVSHPTVCLSVYLSVLAVSSD